MKKIYFLSIILIFAIAYAFYFQCQQIKKNEMNILKLEADFKTLDSKISYFDSEYNFKSDELKPSVSGFSVVKTNFGKFLVKFSDIRSFGNGSKLVLKIGNLSSASIHSFNLWVVYSTLMVDGKKAPERPFESFEINKILRPGFWDTVEVVLEGVPPNQFDSISVINITFKSMQLNE